MRLAFCLKLLLLVGGLLAVTPLRAQAPVNSSTREQLQQLTAQLQNSPNDGPLREKIVTLALTLNPKPVTPDAAIMAEGAAEYAFRNAKANSDFSDAAKQYEKALLLAPWLAADYFNCGVAHERAAENKEAIASFNLYLLAAPKADDAMAVRKRIGGLQYAAQKAGDAVAEQARVAEAESRTAERRAAVYFGLDSGVWTFKQVLPGLIRNHTRTTLEVHGHEMTQYWSDDLNARQILWHAVFTSRQFQAVTDRFNDSVKITISDDGQSITSESFSNGITSRAVYQRTN
jgi:hypothetical protein